MKLLKSFFGILLPLVLIFSFSLVAPKKASAQLWYNYDLHYPTYVNGNNGKAYIPNQTDWFFPSSNGSGTNLEVTMTAQNDWVIGPAYYTVNLQRAISGSWMTVAHAGFPVNDGKYVNFDREYNNSYLYPTTPYRLEIVNNTGYQIKITDIIVR